MAYCLNCGTEIDEEAAFCSVWGEPVEANVSSEYSRRMQ